MEDDERKFDSYYDVLGVSEDSSIDEIRRAYHKLAMQWHPDKWERKNPSLLVEANQKFQMIQEAYSVLSDPKKRQMYDADLYDPNDEEDEGFCDFMDEMFDLMAQVREEEKSCSMEDLQNTFTDLMKSFNFDTPQWFPSPSPQDSMTGLHWNGSGRSGQNSQMTTAPDMNMFGMSNCCR